MIHLVVTRHFGDYKPGDRITDQAVISKIRDSSNHANVVPVKAPDESKDVLEAAPPAKP